jgi:hypothetical protein
MSTERRADLWYGHHRPPLCCCSPAVLITCCRVSIASEVAPIVMFYHRDYDTDTYFSFLPFLPHLPTPLTHPSVRTALTLYLLLILSP